MPRIFPRVGIDLSQKGWLSDIGGPPIMSRAREKVMYVEEKRKEFPCPVCGKRLGKRNLPGSKDVIEDGLYSNGNISIVNSTVILECGFPHYYCEEEEATVDEIHDVVAVIKAEFDDKGKCIQFDILEIQSAE